MKRHLQIFLAFKIVLLCGQAQAYDAQEQQKKLIANILIELPHYIEQKHQEGLPILCVLDDKILYHHLENLNNKRRVYQSVDWVRSDLRNCHVAYASSPKKARKLILQAEQTKTLTIGSYADFVKEGGAIGLVDYNGKIGIEINLSAAAEKETDFNPDLIELSTRVIQ